MVLVVVRISSESVKSLKLLNDSDLQYYYLLQSRILGLLTSATASLKLNSSSPAFRYSSTSFEPVIITSQRRSSGSLKAEGLYYLAPEG